MSIQPILQASRGLLSCLTQSAYPNLQLNFVCTERMMMDESELLYYCFRIFMNLERTEAKIESDIVLICDTNPNWPFFVKSLPSQISSISKYR